jgi:glycerophosphoryl diester phosphodiesterase
MGHRGARGIAPENSIPAFKKAVELKIDGVELDVHLTKDGKLAVMHEMNLKKLAGIRTLIKNLTYDELIKYNISTLFIKNQEKIIKKIPDKKKLYFELKKVQTNTFFLNILDQNTKKKNTFYLHKNGNQFDIVKKLIFSKERGEKISSAEIVIKKDELLNLDNGEIRKYPEEHVPLLNEVLEILKGKLFVNIEIKGGEKIYPGIIDRVVKETENLGYDNILFSSFDGDTLILMKQKYPKLKINALSSIVLNANKYATGLDGVNPFYLFGSKNLVSDMHKMDKTVYVWTVNNVMDMIRFNLYGVDGIITDYPHMLKKVSKTMENVLGEIIH